MPIYEYRCSSCGHSFEKMVKINAPTPACPACGADEARKLISATSFVLKGGGWYRDHYGLKSSSSSDSSGSGSSGSDSSSSSSSSSGDGA